MAIYRPPAQPQQCVVNEIGKVLDHYCRHHESLILVGDVNCKIDADVISSFLDNYNLNSLVRSPTCFKSDNLRCTDLILTNRNKSFQSTAVIERDFRIFTP